MEEKETAWRTCSQGDAGLWLRSIQRMCFSWHLVHAARGRRQKSMALRRGMAWMDETNNRRPTHRKRRVSRLPCDKMKIAYGQR